MGRFIKKLSFFALVLSSSPAYAVDVVFLTQQGPPAKTRLLKTWSPEEFNKISKQKRKISAQTWLMDDTAAKTLELKDLADVDLVTLYGESKVARIPRFLIWRGLLKFEWDSKTQQLHAHAEIDRLVPHRLLIAPEAFQVKNVKKIELAQHSWVYPGTKLAIRTNPAASRGEKLFTQSCLACHSLPGAKSLVPAQLTNDALNDFRKNHSAYPVLTLDARAIRGLEAYRDALASEKPVIKSAP